MIAAFISLNIACQSQMVDPLVANFISNFSLAATQVGMKPDSRGVRDDHGHLATTILTMRGATIQTLEKAFVLLDKNQSKQRLVVGDLLLLMLYRVPSSGNSGTLAALRDPIVPVPGQTLDSAKWPWAKDPQDTWKLEPFAVARGARDLSLMDRLKLFKDFKREN